MPNIKALLETQEELLEALQASLAAFNKLPVAVINGTFFDTYALAAHIATVIKKAKGQ